MEFEKLKSEDIKSMYHLMQQAFPAEQMREYKSHQILYDKNKSYNVLFGAYSYTLA